MKIVEDGDIFTWIDIKSSNNTVEASYGVKRISGR